jgi:hypothetical protein
MPEEEIDGGVGCTDEVANTVVDNRRRGGTLGDASGWLASAQRPLADVIHCISMMTKSGRCSLSRASPPAVMAVFETFNSLSCASDTKVGMHLSVT